MELKAEINERAERGPVRKPMRRRLLAGVAVAGIAAAAFVAVPLVAGSESPAYALTKNSDGSITLKINELRDPGQVEKDLEKMGVKADVTYFKLGKECAPGRYKGSWPQIDSADVKSKDPKVKAKIKELMENSLPAKAHDVIDGGVRIYPREIKPGQTVIMDFHENNKAKGSENPDIEWEFGFDVTDGPVKPCTVIDVSIPTREKNPEAFPPEGS
ncbi:hypothetical protein [Streptosporangium sp. NPDC000396]|uniref:hypothetical protein n=1 Tax=Streptosporangium sp. NPDC000396 TaxID=3366185 RepID=UPI0036739346